MKSLVLITALFCAFNAVAQSIPVPNASFELPETSFADPRVDSWQKTPKPIWFDESQGGSWDQVIGVFKNTAAGSSDHIDNMDGNQGLFLFALPEAGLFQDYESIGGTNTISGHEFNATYQPGKRYDLTVGVLGGGGGMKEGVTLQLALYYRNSNGDKVVIGSTTITNSPTLFPTNTHFVDFNLRIPTVQASDAWASQKIGISLLSTVGFDLQGGYWDLDNVRLASSVAIPNDSFELPETAFADPRIDSWNKTPKPAWFDESQGGSWDQLTGVFLNTAVGSPDHIDNVEGKQAMFLFAQPEAGIFQDYNSETDTNGTPTHAFNYTYEAGNQYRLTVGVMGGGGGMKEGVTLKLLLYYRDAQSNRVEVASTVVTNNTTTFPTVTHLVDFTVETPVVSTNDAWAGQHVGVALLSNVGFDLQGGYWDLDNVRLSIVEPAPLQLSIANAGSGIMVSWQTQAGVTYYLQTSTDLKNWSPSLNPVTGDGGPVTVTIPQSGPHEFFRVTTAP